VLDRVVAVLLLVLAAPVLAAATLLVRRDGGPGLIRVTRVGRHGAPFAMWKVRTMRVAGAGGLAGGPALTGRGDSRVTPVGRLLRGARLDELPQLWNIVRGQMALVGPRPETPEYVDVDDPRWRAVLASPPGVAGATQALVHEWEADLVASGGADVYRDRILPVKLAIDGWYVRSACPSVDLEVVRAVLGPGRGAARRRLLGRVVAAGVAEAAVLGDR
jgi:lipopolysaccharide/colanic/teichoic acid biosynthesis glycosyltransferase